MNHARSLGFFFCIFGLAFSSPRVPASEPDAGQTPPDALETEWAKIQKFQPNLSVREVMGFALEAAGRDVHPELVEGALGLVEKMQDHEAKSRTFGNFRWNWGQPKPQDGNGVEFVVQQAVLLRKRFAAHLTPAARAGLDRLLQTAIASIHAHKVDVGYTNIFLMKTWNLLALGETFDLPELTAEGRAMFAQWREFTARNGIREYLSPTYYGVDLDSLGLIASQCQDADVREQALRALRLFWADMGANWFMPAARLGGAHSRDYDYLGGHGGELDQHLIDAGWLPEGKPAKFRVFADATRWVPPQALGEHAVADLPRFVYQKFGEAPSAWAAQYLGHHFSIGVAGESYGPEDKVFTVNFGGGPQMPVASFVMDGRGDPYGQNKIPTGASGHMKAHHLVPFFASVQRGPEVLFLASYDPVREPADKSAPPLACLLSHIICPDAAQAWIGGAPAAPQSPSIPIKDGICFLRWQDVVIGLRFLLATDLTGDPAPMTLVNDGGTLHVRRLTVVHSPNSPPAGRAMVAIWARAAEGLDDAGFAQFRESFAQAVIHAESKPDNVSLEVPGLNRPLVLKVDPATGQRPAAEGDKEGKEPMSSNGREFETRILNGGECSF